MKLLYLTGTALELEDQSWQNDFQALSKDYNDQVEVFVTAYSDLLHICAEGQYEVIDLRNNRKLNDYDVVHFRNYAFRPSEVGAIAGYLHDNQVAYINSDAKNAYKVSSKLWQMYFLQKNGLPVPSTYFFHHQRVNEALNYLGGLANSNIYPGVVKLIDGMKGSDNHLVNNEAELKSIYAEDSEKQFILQPLIRNDGDYRILFIGLDDHPIAFKRKAAAGSHLNNTSKGGTAEEVTEINPEYANMAKRAAKLMGLEVAGVDLIINSESGRPYILEVNTTPAILTGFDTLKKSQKYLDYVALISKGGDL